MCANGNAAYIINCVALANIYTSEHIWEYDTQLKCMKLTQLVPKHVI